MQFTGLPLRIVTTVESGVCAATLADTAMLIEQDLRTVWGVEAKVRLATRAAPSGQRWLVQQFLGLLSYSRASRTLLSNDLYAVLEDEIAQRPQFIMAHRLPSMFALLRFRERLEAVYFDMDDVEHVVTRRAIGKYAGMRRKFFGILSLPALMQAEKQAMRMASKTFVCSAKDASYLASLYSIQVDAVGVLPNSVAIPAPGAVTGGQVMLMVGAYAYGPNADGADFLIEEILPLVRQRLPQAEMWLAGSGCEALKSFGKSPANVRFLGFVDDLAAVYRQARLVVCPVRYGGGTRVKLIEAAAWSKPIVTTVVGAEGLGMAHERDALFADTPGLFADACVRLIGDDALCARLGANAWKLASSEFDREQIIKRLCADFSKAATK